MLQLADEDTTDEEIARALHLGKSTVERTRRRFVEVGLERALSDRPRPGKPRMLNGKQEALLTALACSDPPEGCVRWTMQLLADRLIELRVVESITDETVRRTLKETTSSRGRRSRDLRARASVLEPAPPSIGSALRSFQGKRIGIISARRLPGASRSQTPGLNKRLNLAKLGKTRAKLHRLYAS